MIQKARNALRLPNTTVLAWLTAASLLLVAATGLAWIAVDLSLDGADFNHPLRSWRHRLLVAHGSIAYLLLWLAGTLLPGHQRLGWPNRRRRRSGLPLALSLFVLAATGLAIYYPPGETARDWLSLTHQTAGVAVAALFVWHVGDRVARLFRRAWQSNGPHSPRRPVHPPVADAAARLARSLSQSDR